MIQEIMDALIHEHNAMTRSDAEIVLARIKHDMPHIHAEY